MNKRVLLTLTLIAGGAIALSACSKHHAANNRNMTAAQASALRAASANRAARMRATTPGTTRATAAMTHTLPHLAYVAKLYPLNATKTRQQINGRAQFGVHNGQLTIRIAVAGTPPGIMHAQHIHGFVQGKAAACPTSTADVNGDGAISQAEAETVTGPPLVPLNAKPQAMNFTDLTYPKAGPDGSYVYQQSFSMSALKSAFAKAHNGKQLDLAKDVVMIHGVLPGALMPSTSAGSGMSAMSATSAATATSAGAAASAGAPKGMAPASLPIACGKITAVNPAS
jgi:hypothetical protein